MSFFKTGKKPRPYPLKSKTVASWGPWQLLAQDGMLPAEARKWAPHAYHPRQQHPPKALGWNLAAVCGWWNAVPAQDLSLPFPLALSEEHGGGLATCKAGYAEAASSQALAAGHETCSPLCSGSIKAVEEPCHCCCAEAKGLSTYVLHWIIKFYFWNTRFLRKNIQPLTVKFLLKNKKEKRNEK